MGSIDINRYGYLDEGDEEWDVFKRLERCYVEMYEDFE